MEFVVLIIMIFVEIIRVNQFVNSLIPTFVNALNNVKFVGLKFRFKILFLIFQHILFNPSYLILLL